MQENSGQTYIIYLILATTSWPSKLLTILQCHFEIEISLLDIV